MAKIVIKFGGTSLGSIERITAAAKIVKKRLGKNNKIIVVVSAMAGKTNELIKQSEKISKKFNRRELDVLLASGEQVTSALLAGALSDLKVKVKSSVRDKKGYLAKASGTSTRVSMAATISLSRWSDEASSVGNGVFSSSNPFQQRVF